MRNFLGFMILIAMGWGCSSQCLVRDPVVYRAEMDFMEQASSQQSDALEEFIQAHCTCGDNGKFTTEKCRKAADLVVTARTRVPWHKAMNLYLGGLEDKRPPKTPPKIPAPESLCPVLTGGTP